MPDLLVHLLKLPPLEPILAEIERDQITVRRAQTFEITAVTSFVQKNFSIAWADEITVGFTNKPVSIYIAIQAQKVVGFAAYECTRRDFFGPMGVLETLRGRGVGNALLLSCLWGMREMGYVYGIIGGVGPVDFYKKTVGATMIEDSTPGIYTNLLK